MKRKFHDYLTLLTSTEKLLTQARLKLAPWGTLNSVPIHLIQWSVSRHWDQDWFESNCAWEEFVNAVTNVVGLLRALRLIPSGSKVNLTGWVTVKRRIFLCRVTCTTKTDGHWSYLLHSYGRFLFFDMFLDMSLTQMHLKSKQSV